MPKALSYLFLFGLMLLFVPIIVAQEKTESIRLWVFHNGEKQAAPDLITFSFNNQTVNIPIQNEQFEIPSQILSATEVTFSTDLPESHITANISKESFRDVALWILLIADKSYGVDYDFAVPKRANVRKSCIISFSPTNADGWFMFARNCRTKRK